MYGYLSRFMAPRFATIVSAIWFATLIVLTLLCSAEPSADFRYGKY